MSYRILDSQDNFLIYIGQTDSDSCERPFKILISTRETAMCQRCVLFLMLTLASHYMCGNSLAEDPTMTDQQIGKFARLALEGIEREYPNKPSDVMVDANSVQSPRDLHPVFYGCFDWHSSVHGHWMLVRLAEAVARRFVRAGGQEAS